MRLQCDFWAVLQAESTPKAAGRQRFPRSATPVLNNGCEKPPRTPGTMSKSGAVCCETVQKSPYEDETGAALRGGIGLAFIVMGTAFVETWESGGAGRAKWPVKGPSPDGGPRKRPSPGRKPQNRFRQTDGSAETTFTCLPTHVLESMHSGFSSRNQPLLGFASICTYA